jgi:signal transduction histidine kinase
MAEQVPGLSGSIGQSFPAPELIEIGLGRLPIVITAQDHELRYTATFNSPPDWGASRIVGLTDADFLPRAEDVEVVTALKRAVLETGEERRAELPIVLPNGERRFYDLTLRPRLNDAGQITHVVTLTIDITDRKRLEDELRAANELKDEFVSLISHELRTPLTTLIGLARVLASQSEPIDQEQRQALASEIAASGGRLFELVQSLLLVGRLDHDPVELEPVLLSAVFRDLSDEWLKQGQVPPLLTTIAAEVPPVEGQVEWVKQVIRNLAGNAAKYGSPEHAIQLSASRHNGHVLVEVLDRGPGVPLEFAERVFEPFVRTDDARVRAPGNGLGLAVCRRLVELMGGSIWVEGRDGGGARFCFTLRAID